MTQERKGFEPYFDKFVTVAIIDHKQKTVTPCHGYCLPHLEGKKSEKWANKKGYKFLNY